MHAFSLNRRSMLKTAIATILATGIGTPFAWADEPIARTPVEYTEQSLKAIAIKGGEKYPNLQTLITQMLELDPRPAFQKRRMPPDLPEAQGTRYGFNLFEFDVKWEIRDGKFLVLDVIDLADFKKSSS